jgi:hypothetical protein
MKGRDWSVSTVSLKTRPVLRAKSFVLARIIFAISLLIAYEGAHPGVIVLIDEHDARLSGHRFRFFFAIRTIANALQDFYDDLVPGKPPRLAIGSGSVQSFSHLV